MRSGEKGSVKITITDPLAEILKEFPRYHRGVVAKSLLMNYLTTESGRKLLLTQAATYGVYSKVRKKYEEFISKHGRDFGFEFEREVESFWEDETGEVEK